MKTHQPPYLPFFRRARKREKVNSTTRNANSEVDPFRVSMRSSADEINNVPWERLAVRLIGCQKERERDGLDGNPPPPPPPPPFFSTRFLVSLCKTCGANSYSFFENCFVDEAGSKKGLYVCKAGIGEEKYWKKLSYSRTFDTRSPRIRSVYFSFLTSIACRNLEIYIPSSFDIIGCRCEIRPQQQIVISYYVTRKLICLDPVVAQSSLVF